MAGELVDQWLHPDIKLLPFSRVPSVQNPAIATVSTDKYDLKLAEKNH